MTKSFFRQLRTEEKMARFKFTFKRLRMDLDEGADGEFNFESDDDEVVANTAAAVAAVELPAKSSTADAQQRNIFKDFNGTLLQSSGKRRRETRSWETQGQWKKPRLKEKLRRSTGIQIKPWGSWLGNPSHPQRVSHVRASTPVSRLAANVMEKRGSLGSLELSMKRAPSRNVQLRTKPTGSSAKPKLIVMRGDPTDWSTEAIVSDTNSLLRHNSRLAATIVHKGGLEIQRQSTEWVYYRGEVPVGSAMWTTAGKLSSRFIVFTVGPDLSHHRWPTPRYQLDLRRAVRSALNVVNDLGVTSVAIPALCTGVSRYPKYLAAREIVAECLAFSDECSFTSLRLITLMNEDEVTTSIFVQAMKDARQQRQLERQWAVVAMQESARTFGSLLDGSSDDSSIVSETSGMVEPKKAKVMHTTSPGLLSGWTV